MTETYSPVALDAEMLFVICVVPDNECSKEMEHDKCSAKEEKKTKAKKNKMNRDVTNVGVPAQSSSAM